MCNQCCGVSTYQILLTRYLINIYDLLKEINCSTDNTNELLCNVTEELERVYASLASTNPMAIAAEYPNLEDNAVTYSTTKVRLLDMLNPNIVVLFKGTFTDNVPVYFKDIINYGHIVSIGDKDTPAMANELVNNYPYPALYVGNYIILNPTELTLEDFKSGIL